MADVITTTLTRSQRAMQLLMQTRTRWAVAPVGVRVPSQTQKGVSYVVTLDSCTCPASKYHAEDAAYACKHRIAAAILMGRKS
jgi:SWIM zinc finger